MPTSIANAAAKAILDMLTARLNVGGAGRVDIYTGLSPTYCDDAATGTLLVSFTLPNPAFNNAIDTAPDATATAKPITPANASASGTFGWYRAFAGDGGALLQGIVGVEMIVSSAGVTSGAPVTISSWIIRQPEAG